MGPGEELLEGASSRCVFAAKNCRRSCMEESHKVVRGFFPMGAKDEMMFVAPSIILVLILPPAFIKSDPG